MPFLAPWTHFRQNNFFFLLFCFRKNLWKKSSNWWFQKKLLTYLTLARTLKVCYKGKFTRGSPFLKLCISWQSSPSPRFEFDPNPWPSTWRGTVVRAGEFRSSPNVCLEISYFVYFLPVIKKRKFHFLPLLYFSTPYYQTQCRRGFSTYTFVVN